MSAVLGIELSVEEDFMVKVLTHRDYLDCEKVRLLHQSIGDKKLFELCEQNKISSIAADALGRCYGQKKLADHWLHAYKDVDVCISYYMVELEKVAGLLASHNIPLIALKNSGITKALYPYYGACPMGDIDVLVKKNNFRKAHNLLVEHGYNFEFRSKLEEETLDKAEQSGGAEYTVNLPNGDRLWFELQWRPIAGRWIRPDQEPCADELMERSVQSEGSNVRILSPEDNLLQVALHTAKHTFVRAPGFRLHTDVDRIVRSTNINWDIFVARVCTLQVKTATFFSLAFAYDLLGTPIPLDVLDRIRPIAWKQHLMVKWLKHVGLFDPDNKKWGKVGYMIFVALLYDDIKGLFKGIFPPVTSINDYYSNKKKLWIPFLYLRRIIKLIFKRTLVK